jgi:CheY-like chemotaxis protein
VSILQQVGCKVLDTYNGIEALRLLNARPEIEVLFADVRMPGMSGPELVEEARRFRPDLKVVLTSGYVGREEVPQDIPFVPKPWRPHDLADAVVGGLLH